MSLQFFLHFFLHKRVWGAVLESYVTAALTNGWDGGDYLPQLQLVEGCCLPCCIQPWRETADSGLWLVKLSPTHTASCSNSTQSPVVVTHHTLVCGLPCSRTAYPSGAWGWRMILRSPYCSDPFSCFWYARDCLCLSTARPAMSCIFIGPKLVPICTSKLSTFSLLTWQVPRSKFSLQYAIRQISIWPAGFTRAAILHVVGVAVWFGLYTGARLPWVVPRTLKLSSWR